MFSSHDVKPHLALYFFSKYPNANVSPTHSSCGFPQLHYTLIHYTLSHPGTLCYGCARAHISDFS